MEAAYGDYKEVSDTKETYEVLLAKPRPTAHGTVPSTGASVRQASSSCRSLVIALPGEIVQQVMSFVDVREVARYAMVCSRFCQEARHTVAEQSTLDLRW